MPSFWPAVSYLLLTPGEGQIYDRSTGKLIGSAVLRAGDLRRFCFVSDAEALTVQQALRRRGVVVRVQKHEIRPLDDVA